MARKHVNEGAVIVQVAEVVDLVEGRRKIELHHEQGSRFVVEWEGSRWRGTVYRGRRKDGTAVYTQPEDLLTHLRELFRDGYVIK